MPERKKHTNNGIKYTTTEVESQEDSSILADGYQGSQHKADSSVLADGYQGILNKEDSSVLADGYQGIQNKEDSSVLADGHPKQREWLFPSRRVSKTRGTFLS